MQPDDNVSPIHRKRNPELWWISSYSHQHLLENPSPVPSQVFTHGICSIFQLPTHSIFWKNPWASVRQPTFRSLRWICVVDIVSKSCFLAGCLQEVRTPRREGKKKIPYAHPSLPPAKYIEREEKMGQQGNSKRSGNWDTCFLSLHVLHPWPPNARPPECSNFSFAKAACHDFFPHEKSSTILGPYFLAHFFSSDGVKLVILHAKNGTVYAGGDSFTSKKEISLNPI